MIQLFLYRQCINDGNLEPFCPPCDIHHRVDRLTRTKVFLSSSTISGVPLIEGWTAQDMHCEWETIPGAKLDMLRDAWRTGYNNHTRPTDTLLVSGLNDIKAIVHNIIHFSLQLSEEEVISRATDEFMRKLENLWTTINTQNNSNTLHIAYLLRVPGERFGEFQKRFKPYKL